MEQNRKKTKESVVLVSYSEERLKQILYSVFEESLDSFLKEKLKNEKDEVEYLTIPASAKLVNKSTRTLYNWIAQGIIQRYYIGDSPYLKKSELLNLPSIKSKKKESR